LPLLNILPVFQTTFSDFVGPIAREMHDCQAPNHCFLKYIFQVNRVPAIIWYFITIPADFFRENWEGITMQDLVAQYSACMFLNPQIQFMTQSVLNLTIET
jgi:hypothetical protein